MDLSPSWFRPRGYLHFDAPIGKDRALAIVSNAKEVARHSFYPLISYGIVTTKVRRDAKSGILEKREKTRPIRYAAHVDAHIFSYYAYILGLKYEEALRAATLGDCVLAFRKLGDSNIEFAAKAFAAIRRMGTCTAMAFDVKGFFDHLDHKILKAMWSRVLGDKKLPPDHYAVYKALTKFSWVDRDQLYSALGISLNNPKNERRRICSAEQFRGAVRNGELITTNREIFGIPQGTPISALLSNIYMLDFDERLRNDVIARGGEYIRYCDDILVITPTPKAVGLAELVQHRLEELKLSVNPSKTETTRFWPAGRTQRCDRPLQYLGFLFDGERILIRSAALAKFSGRMNQGVRLAKATAKSRNAKRLMYGLPIKSIYKRKLYDRYSHLGQRNFVRYGLRAAEILKSAAIKQQLRPLWGRLRSAIEKE